MIVLHRTDIPICAINEDMYAPAVAGKPNIYANTTSSEYESECFENGIV